MLCRAKIFFGATSAPSSWIAQPLVARTGILDFNSISRVAKYIKAGPVSRNLIVIFF